MFDDRVIGRPPVDKRNGVQRDPDADEVEDFVDEGAGEGKSHQPDPVVTVCMANLVPAPQLRTWLIEKKRSKESLPPRHDHGSVFQRQFHRVIPTPWAFAIMRSCLQNREFLFKVAVDEWQ